MRTVFLFWAGLMAACVIAASAVAYSIEPSVARQGQDVTFVGTFPQAAFRGSHHPQFHDNPYGYVYCTDEAGTTVLSGGMVNFIKGAKAADGFSGTSYPFLLPATATLCQIATGYWTDDKAGVTWNAVSWTQFEVTA